MKKYVLWPLLAAIGGVGAFLLRLLQRSTGFEVDTGLPIPGNLYAILLVAWFVVLAAVCLLAARTLLPADREDPPLFPTGFSVASPGLLTPAVMGLFLLAASGVLDLLFGFSGASALTGSGETVTVFVTAQGSQLFSGREHLVVGLLSLLSAASLLPAVPACRIRPEGGARKPFQSPLLLVPVCCLVVRLVLTYRVVSVDPPLRRLCGASHRLLPGHSGGSAGSGPAAVLPGRRRDAFRLPAPADGGTGRALGQYLTVYHKIPVAGSARRGDFPFVHKYRGNRETDQPFGWSVSLFFGRLDEKKFCLLQVLRY